MKRVLIVGCGYSGLRLGERALELGHRALGTTRSESRASAIAAAGIEPLVGELGGREVRRAIDRFGPQVIFYLVPPQAGAVGAGESDGRGFVRGREQAWAREHEQGRRREDPLIATLEASRRAPLEAFVYASSTSVYGDRDGGWVDESAMPAPDGEAGRRRLAAERTVMQVGWDLQAPIRICRLAGIYGPGRTLRGRLERREYALIRGRDPWINRIHVEDLVSALLAAWLAGKDGRIYNLTDDAPHRASAFAQLAARLHGLPAPEPVDESEAASRLGANRLRRKLSSKRVRNGRLREELAVTLRHPTYRSGLPAAVEAEKTQAKRAKA